MELDATTLSEVTVRLRRAQGQLGGVVQMIENERDCADIVTQLAAVGRAIDRAAFRLISSGLVQCVTEEKDGSESARFDREKLEKLFLALA